MYRTYEPTRDRLVAVKVFRLDVTPEQAQALADELARAAEAGLFHPSIVEPIAAGIEGTVAYRAEEYVAAESLDVAMRHYAPAALDKALPFITQLAGAIDFARAAGVGHGALHPRDIFVTPDEARATGFGVVEALERVGQRAPVRRPYSAPERIAGEAWSTPADVFSLAAIAYELLTAKRPSGAGDQIGALTGDNVGDRAGALHAVLARAMHEQPASRYPTALAFAAALEAAAGGEQAADAKRDVAAPSAAVAGVPLNHRDAPPEPEEPEPESQELEEPDVALERDEDEAHHELSMRERAQPEPGLVDEAAIDRFADEFPGDEEPALAAAAGSPNLTALDDEVSEAEPAVAQAAALEDPRALEPVEQEVREETLAGSTYDEEPEPAFYRGTVQRERRTAMLPLALFLIVGLLLGFGIGHLIGGRDRGSSPESEASVPAGAPAAAAPSGRAWSEQAVTPSQPGAQPPVAPPPVPGDAPPAAAERPAPGAPPRAAPPEGAAPPVDRRATGAPRGRLVVQSTPAGAGVTVNGRWRGRTPLTLEDLAFGPYTVRIVQPGFAVAREEFSLSAAQPSRTMNARLRPADAAPAPVPGLPPARGVPPAPGLPPAPVPGLPAEGTGSVYVDSRPRGARVMLDGREVGVTPLTIPGVKAGNHLIRLELADHRTWVTTTRVEPGQERRVTGSLDRIR